MFQLNPWYHAVSQCFRVKCFVASQEWAAGSAGQVSNLDQLKACSRLRKHSVSYQAPIRELIFATRNRLIDVQMCYPDCWDLFFRASLHGFINATWGYNTWSTRSVPWHSDTSPNPSSEISCWQCREPLVTSSDDAPDYGAWIWCRRSL